MTFQPIHAILYTYSIKQHYDRLPHFQSRYVSRFFTSKLIPTDYELREIQAEFDAEQQLAQDEYNADAWVDDMMMGIIEDIQY